MQDLVTGRPVSVTFDGQCSFCEIECLIFFVVINYQLICMCVALSLLKKSPDGAQLARWIFESIIRVGSSLTFVEAATRDRASVNEAALDNLRPFAPQLVNIPCYMHTTDHVGDKLDEGLVRELINAYVSLFSNKVALLGFSVPDCACLQQKRPRLLWAELSPVGPTLLGETRFWSKYETLVDIFLRYKLVVDSFVPKLLQAGIAPATVARIAKIIYDPDLERTFATNMAAIVEYARPFVKATYFLEGDGFLSPFVYDTIMDLQMWCDTWGPEVAQHTTAVALHRCDDDAARAAVLVQAAVDKMQVGIDYFYWRFIQEGCVMEPTLRMYKACRFFVLFVSTCCEHERVRQNQSRTSTTSLAFKIGRFFINA